MAEKEVKTSKKADLIKVILALLAVLMGTYIFVDPGKVTYEPDPASVKKIDSLQAINDKLASENSILDSTVTSYESIIEELNFKVDDLIEYKKRIADYYANRHTEIEETDPNEIDTFFMNRYDYANDSE